MVGTELVVGYLLAWALRTARRVGRRADTEVDRVVDAGLDRLHDVVAARLGRHPALAHAMTETTDSAAASGAVPDNTRDRLRLALEQAAAQDPAFHRELTAAAAEVDAAARAVSGNTFNGPTAFQVGDGNTQTNTFGS